MKNFKFSSCSVELSSNIPLAKSGNLSSAFIGYNYFIPNNYLSSLSGNINYIIQIYIKIEIYCIK